MARIRDRLHPVLQELVRRKVVRSAVIYVTITGGLLALLDNFSRMFPAAIDPVFPYVLLVAVVAFPLVLVSAWAFEWSWSGIHPRAAPDGHPVSMATRLGAVAAVALVSLGFGAGAFAIWEPPGARTPDAGEPPPLTSIAVLPLDDYSADKSLGPLALVVGEFLTSELTGVEGLTVRSRVEAELMRAQGLSPRSQGNLGSWIEGSVAGTPDAFVITLQFIDGATGDHIEAWEFPGSGMELEPILDSLVVAMAHAVRQELGVELEKRAVEAEAANEEAANHYTLGRRAMQAGEAIRSLEREQAMTQFARADSLFARASELDADWIAPLVQRGWAEILLGHAGSDRAGTVPPTFARRAEAHADLALERRPDHAEALELRGVARFWLAESAADPSAALYDAAERDLVAATLADPGRGKAWETRARIEWARGDFATARTSAEHALDLDHFLVDRRAIIYDLVQTLLDQREIEAATRRCAQGRRENPAAPDFFICNLFILTNVAEPPALLDDAGLAYDSLRIRVGDEAWPQYRPWAEMWLSILHARRGQRDSALAALARARGEGGETVDAYDEARIMVALGEHERAIDLLKTFLEIQPSRKDYVRNDWWFESLQENPRFVEITGG